MWPETAFTGPLMFDLSVLNKTEIDVIFLSLPEKKWTVNREDFSLDSGILGISYQMSQGSEFHGLTAN